MMTIDPYLLSEEFAGLNQTWHGTPIVRPNRTTHLD